MAQYRAEKFPPGGDRHADATRRSPRRVSCRGFGRRHVSPTCPLPAIAGGGDFAVRRNRRGFPAAPLPPPSLRFGAGTFPPWGDRYADATRRFPSMGDRYADAIRRFPRRGEYTGFSESGGRGAVLWGAPLPASDAAGPFPSMGNPILAQRAETRGSS
jgi:hypothetical protein